MFMNHWTSPHQIYKEENII